MQGLRATARVATTVGMALALVACGSGGGRAGSDASTTTKAGATGGRFVASVCDAYLAATKDEQRPSAQAHALVARLGDLDAPAASRAKLAAMVRAMQDVERVWSSTATITTDAFSTAARDASAAYGRAATAIGLDPCPRPGATTTTAAAAKPAWAFDSVARPQGGDGIWLYFTATCPEGHTLTGVTSPWEPNPGAPDRSFAALVPGLAAAQPFTGAAADDAFAHRPEFTGACA
jgi:hypothetical protein